jgi:hypothetical protein
MNFQFIIWYIIKHKQNIYYNIIKIKCIKYKDNLKYYIQLFNKDKWVNIKINTEFFK